MSLNVSALADFTNETAGKIIPKMVFEGLTTSILPIQEGIKHIEPLQIFDVDLQIQSANCTSTMSGSLVATQRDITVTPRVSYDGLCLDDLNVKSLGISSLDKGSYNETFKLAGIYTDLLVNQFQKANDEFLWNATDGLGLLTSGSTAGVVIPNEATGSVSASTILGIMDVMIENIHEDVADRDDLTIWMSVANFRKVITALRSANNFHYDPSAVSNRTGLFQMVYPFQNVKVVGTRGVIGDRIVLMPDAYTVIGVDAIDDAEKFSLWYDIDTDKLKHRIKTKLGVQVAFPEYIVSNGL